MTVGEFRAPVGQNAGGYTICDRDEEYEPSRHSRARTF